MNAAIVIAVNLIASVVGKLTTNAEVTSVIALLQNWLPTIITEIEDLVPVVQGIISTLQGSSLLTADQVAAVDALNASADAAFEAAATAAGSAA